MVSQSGNNNRKRTAHVIKRANGKRLPQRFIFFDTETETINDQGTQRLKLIVACSWVIDNRTGVEKIEWYHTRCGKRFYTWLTSRLKAHITTRILSANIWFDFRTSALYKYFKMEKWFCVGAFSKGHTLIFSFKLGNHRIEFVNIQNYFNVPVRVIGKSVGLEKYEVDFKTVGDKDLLTYCRRDVEIIFKAFRNLYLFVKENNLGGIPYTLPGLAFSAYTHSFMKRQINIHVKESVLTLERQSYFGGRCECFFIGRPAKGMYYKVDINSMYPFVMSNNYYPVKYLKAGVNVSVDAIVKTSPLYCFIAECEIETRLPVYAKRLNDKLIFPVGRFVTTLTTPSLLFGITRGHIKKIIKVACYKKAIIFKEFVNYFYNKRLSFRSDNNPAFAYVCKLILNSLYGKFGQRSSKVVYVGVNNKAKDIRRLIIDAETHMVSIHQVFFGRETITDQGEDEAINSMPAISAHVTDHARLLLWSLIEKAGRRNCFYCDTDSIILNESGMKNLTSKIHPDRLGLLKIEAKSANVNIKGAKNYIFGGDTKIKGIPKRAKQNKNGSFTYSVFPGMVSELRQGIREDYRIEIQTRYLTGVYDKGIVLPSGQVKPFNLKEGVL
jgi:hypothetical protein